MMKRACFPLLLVLGTLPAQAPPPKPLAKHAVDQGLRFLFLQGATPMEKSSTPVLDAARYLVASAKCHRAYTLEDGPVIRPFLDLLIKNRRSQGGFYGEDSPDPVLSTRWAVEAFTYLDPQGYAPEIQMARRFLKSREKKGGTGPLPFEALVEGYARKLSALPAGKRPELLLGWVLGLVRGQDPKGFWKGEKGILQTTLDRVVHLVALEQFLWGKKKVPSGELLPPFVEKGIDFLVSRAKEGKWYLAGAPHPGITALCLSAILMRPEAKRSEKDKAAIEKAIQYLLSCQQPDGSFSAGGTPVYVTSAVIEAFLAAGRPELRPAIRKGMSYLLFMQNIEKRGYTPGDRDYGSIGYGGDNRGDLSNLQMALDALRSAGLPKDSEALAKAVTFLQRTQNLASRNDYKGTVLEKGKKVPVQPGNDGGACYYPGHSNAGYIRLADGTLVPRSYGSMTWALLKSYILCGLSRDDERVQAAWNWLRAHYSLDMNPGFPESEPNKRFQGLFYYYLTMARTLAIMGVDKVEVPVRDKTGKTTLVAHDWRAEMLAKLKALQKPDGSWINEKASRWMEGNPDLTTAYAVLVAAHCLKAPNLPLPK